MPNHYINTPNRQTTQSGHCVYEIHIQHIKNRYDTLGGWSIRFVEALNNPDGKEQAITEALDDIYSRYTEADLQQMSSPESITCIRHDGWESLRILRQIRPPKAGNTIRGPKRSKTAEELFEFLENVS